MTSDDTSPPRPGAAQPTAAERTRDAPEGFVARLLARLRLRGSASIRGDLQDVLSEGATAGDDFLPQERAMLQNVLALRTRRVYDVMVPRADIVAVAAEISLGELLRVFRTAGHSRLPVYAETLDDPRGMIHIRDFLDYLAAGAEQADAATRPDPAAPDLSKVDLGLRLSAAKILRPVLFVPPSMPALDLLVKMQASRTHMALVIDEYGGTDGLVSMEDIMEIIVGEIEDEHDEAEGPLIVKGADGSWLADARTPLEDAAEAVGLPLGEGEWGEDVDTLGGLLASLAGRVPVRGEMIAHPAGIEFEVLDADPRRVKRLRIHQRPDPATAAPTTQTPPAA